MKPVLLFLGAAFLVILLSLYVKLQLLAFSNATKPQPQAITYDLLNTDIPEIWQVLERKDCGIQFSIPTSWTLSEQNDNCMTGYSDGSNDRFGFCIKSPDFQGYLGAPVDTIELGSVLQVSCSTLYAKKDFDIKDHLQSCLADKAKGNDNVCRLIKTATLTWLQYRSYQYTTQINNVYVQVLVSSPNTTQMQILSSIKPSPTP